ncbi:hypothetical protein GCM10008018_31010 [Paenibacillus marchantiophytorum]|uniref:Uncharacterized protein n=1 Tax=Paenibacillus marchantiophytorum TaxID=1619310 RepID=A0ABQ1EQQ7_9BACL|nr:hypothetical protein GCM10008018_31010 [Paenibacillus marchantiophytorum]
MLVPSTEPARILPVNPFDEEKQYLPKTISSSELAKMEVLFNQARKLQDELDSVDIQYNDLLNSAKGTLDIAIYSRKHNKR